MKQRRGYAKKGDLPNVSLAVVKILNFSRPRNPYTLTLAAVLRHLSDMRAGVGHGAF